MYKNIKELIMKWSRGEISNSELFKRLKKICKEIEKGGK